MTYKVSVIIPAYNEEAYIGACLDSLMLQEDMPDEIIVVDNNSIDKTAEIVRRYPVRLLKEKKQGNIHARNKGFNEAKYEIIARTDADTIVGPDWIKRIKEDFADKNIVGLTGPSHYYDVPLLWSGSAHTAFAVNKSFFHIVRNILRHNAMYGANFALRKEGWEKVKNDICLEDTEVHEDIDLAIHLAAFGEIKYDKQLIVNASFRRWRRPEPYFEYSYRMVKSVHRHKKLGVANKSKKFFKEFITRYLI